MSGQSSSRVCAFSWAIAQAAASRSRSAAASACPARSSAAAATSTYVGERQLAHVAAVEPAELALVEDRRRAADALDREPLDQLGRREDGLVVLRPPAEQGQVVAQGRREVAGIAELLHRGGAVALGELLAVRAVEQRQVRVAGRLAAQRLEYEQLLGRVREMVVAADHIGDPHLEIVDGDREVVQRRAVAARDHEVVGEPVLEPHRPADHVLDRGLALVGNLEPDRRPLPRPRLAAVAGVAVRLLVGANVVRGRGVRVGAARFDQLGDPLAMAIAALGLAHRALVPVELEPAQGVEDLLDVLGSRALAVGVLDPEHEGSARAPAASQL